MGRISLIAFAIVTSILAVQAPAAAQNPVVVELFTSEGCSSCPPADALLVKLSAQQSKDGPPLILMGEHVDYWNYIGWTDRFSSKQFSERQSEYAGALHAQVYTPQMVIDGQEQFVGNDAGDVHARIAAAAKKAKPAQVQLTWEGNGKLRVSVHSGDAVKAKVLLAVTEDGLSTQVQKGENGGQTLHHAAVVRQLRDVGEVKNGVFEKALDVSRQDDWNGAELKVAVLVQDSGNKKILGAGEIGYPHN
jgi:hypothetical protein